MSTLRHRVTVAASTAVLSTAMAVPAVMAAAPSASAATPSCAHPHHYPPRHCGKIAVDRDVIHRGHRLFVTGTDWKHDEPVTLDLSGRHCGRQKTVIAGGGGNFTTHYHVRGHCKPGHHFLRAFGQNSGYADSVAITVKR